MTHKTVNRIGWFASMMAISMFGSYVDQIRLNLSGQKGSEFLAIATIVNCVAWLLYAFCKEKKDLPMISCNGIGFIFGIITLISMYI